MSWKEVRIEIETFSTQAEDRIRSLDFSELSSEFPPELDNHNGKFIYVKRNVDYFDDYVGDMYSGPFFMMRVIVDALGSQGKAVMVLKATEWEDEFHSCIVYYYLGDEIRTRVFFDNDTGCYYFNDFLSALLDMPTDKLTEIYKEMNDGEDIETEQITDETDRIVYERRGYLAFSIAGALGYSDLQNVKENIIEAYNGPLVASLFNEINEMKKSCSCSYGELDDGAFIPTLDWETKGIVKYTEKEKQVLSAPPSNHSVNESTQERFMKYRNKMEEACKQGRTLQQMIDAGRKVFKSSFRYDTNTFEQAVRNLDRDANIVFQGKHFVLTGFEQYESNVIKEIEERGGIYHSSMVKAADYLIVCLECPGSNKVKRALYWREKGETNQIVSDYQMWQAIFEKPGSDSE